MRMLRSRTTCLVVGFLAVCLVVGCIEKHFYFKAEEFFYSKDYENAIEYYGRALVYKDSSEKKNAVKKYAQAERDLEEGNYTKAKDSFFSIKGLWDVKDKIDECEKNITSTYDGIYEQALSDYNQGDYYNALLTFKLIAKHEGVNDLISKCHDGIRNELSNVISAATLYSMGIGRDEVKKSGTIDYGQDEIIFKDLISVDCGGYYTVGLYRKGKAIVFGDIPWLDRKIKKQYRDVLQVSAGYDYVAILHEDMTVEFDGYNSSDTYEEPLNFKGWHDIKKIDSGYHLTAGLDKNGNIWLTGRNSKKILAEIENNKEWKNIVDIAVGGGSKKSEGFIVGLKKDGNVVFAGKVDERIKESFNGVVLKKVKAADFHVVGLTHDGKLVGDVVLNNPKWKEKRCCDFSSWPKTTIIDFAVGNGVTMGVDKDGVVYCSGYDHQKQIPKSGLWKDINISINEYHDY